jgi:hypothetical protein
LESGKLICELTLPFGKRAILSPESCLVDIARLVQLIKSVDLLSELVSFLFECFEEISLCLDSLITLFEVPGDLIWGKEEALELLMEDGFEVINRHLVSALCTDVLRGVRGHIHLLPAGTEGKAGEEMYRLLRRTFSFLPLRV